MSATRIASGGNNFDPDAEIDERLVKAATRVQYLGA